jgi:uncharacterized HAD superfamily protein
MDTHKKVLGVDFDDVLVRTGHALAEFHNATYGTAYARDDVTNFDLSEVWDCTPEEADRRIAEFTTTKFHHEAQAVLGARDALQALSETYDIMIVTGRSDEWRDPTIEWLEKNFIGLYREIHFTTSPGPGRARLKSEIVREFNMVSFIDDALHFAKDVATLGIPVLLFDTPWNQGTTSPGITRVHSWKEILGILKAP